MSPTQYVMNVQALMKFLREAMKRHDIPGKVVLIGTPAEESGGGKVKLLDAGAYKGLGACMMIHPGPGPSKTGQVGPTLAVTALEVDFYGHPAHAASAPWEGINALDAAVSTYTAISNLRQQLKPGIRVHGIIAKGGDAPNIIPEHTQMQYSVRAQTPAQVEETLEKITACIEAGAKASGCTFQIQQDLGLYKELVNVEALGQEYASTMSELYDIPIAVGNDEEHTIYASTDFGNVTYELPGCHPMFGIPTVPNGANHTAEFTAVAGSDEGHEETWKASTGMACVGLRFLTDDGFAKQVRQDFERDQKRLN
ncbi:hypothetical protein V866_002082 [Kwoniella sp. B9012]